MNRLEELQQKFNQALQNQQWPESPATLYQPMEYALSNGGKRMRPLLVLLGCKAFSENIDDALEAALAMELFHNFTLLHDDIMDDAPLRRGSATVHTKWDSNVAILAGDAMVVHAYEHLIRTPSASLLPVLNVFNRTAIEVCEGQQFDMDFEKQDSVSIDQYIEMIRLKTAVLLAACLKVGALVGGADEKNAQLLYEFGLNTGIAFQLQDDLLDVFGESRKFGKQPGGDIIANKKTFLLLKALELADGPRKVELESWLNATNETEKVQGVTAVYQKLGVRELAEQRMKEFYHRGLASLDQVKGNAEWLRTLRNFSDELMHRES